MKALRRFSDALAFLALLVLIAAAYWGLVVLIVWTTAP